MPPVEAMFCPSQVNLTGHPSKPIVIHRVSFGNNYDHNLKKQEEREGFAKLNFNGKHHDYDTYPVPDNEELLISTASITALHTHKFDKQFEEEVRTCAAKEVNYQEIVQKVLEGDVKKRIAA